jgi:hypothetical protein
MFQRPYYHPRQEQPYYHYNQEVNSFPHQPFYENSPYNGQSAHQTPYEYFAKPHQPNWVNTMQQTQGNYAPHPPMKPINGFMSNFQNQDGKVDIDKMLGTVGQMANTYHQVSPIFKQFGTFLKGFR